MLGWTVDKAVSAFLQDLEDRGLSDKVLLVLTGDFGRTPTINKKGGRDHWARLGTLAFAGGGELADLLAPFERYHPLVFMTPPWVEIYQTDAARRHDFSEAVGEYDRLMAAYAALDYRTIILPKVGVAERVDFILAALR